MRPVTTRRRSRGALALLLAAGCGSGWERGGASGADAGPDTAPVSLAISGSVVDDTTGAPVAGAHVSTEPLGLTSDTAADGGFLVAAVPPGRYSLLVAAAGYHTLAVPAFDAPGEPTEHRLLGRRHDGALVSGRVVAPDGSGVPDVIVRAEPFGEEVTSAPDGTFALADLPPAPVRLFAASAALDLLPAVTAELPLTPGQHAVVRLVLAGRPPPEAGYAGSEACGGCHAAARDRWARSGHARTLGGPEALVAEAHAAAAHGAVTVPLGPAGRAKVVGLPDGGLSVAIEAADGRRAAYVAAAVIGSGARGQVPLARVRGALHALPVAWSALKTSWVPGDGTAWLEGGADPDDPDADASFATACAGCHTTGLELQVGVDGPPVPEYAEAGVGCERCHGAASAHVADPMASPGRGVLTPSDLGPDAGAAPCSHCHSRGTATGAVGGVHPAFAWGPDGRPQPWQAVAELLDDAPLDWDGQEQSRGNHQQTTDLARSAHGRSDLYRLGCLDCHDAHGSTDLRAQLVEPVEDNTLCRRCHGEALYAGPAEPRVHAAHRGYDPEETGTGRCVGCHMARTATLLPWDPDTTDGDTASHALAVMPPEASRPAPGAGPGETPPSACLACHLDAGRRLEAVGGCPCPAGDPADPATWDLLDRAFSRMFPGAGDGQ